MTTWMGLDTVFGIGAWHRFGIDWGPAPTTPPATPVFIAALDAAGFDVTVNTWGPTFYGEVRSRITGKTANDFYQAALPFGPSSIVIEGSPSPAPGFSSEWASKVQKLFTLSSGGCSLKTWLPILIGIVGVGVAIYFGMRKK